ncbi:MAG: ATP-binding protein [Myxococcota bacterium]
MKATLSPMDPVRMQANLQKAFELRHKDAVLAHELATEELERGLLRGNVHVVAKAYVVLNYAVGPAWDPEAMWQRLTEAFAVLAQVEDDWGLTRAADLLAYIHEGYQGNYPAALYYTEAALEAARRCKDQYFEAHALGSMAGILTAADDLELARARLEEAEAIADQLDSETLRIRLTARRARWEERSGNISRSLELLTSTLELARSTKDLPGEFLALQQLARTHENHGDTETAMALHELALAGLTGELRSLLGPGHQVGLARLYLRAGRPGAAIPHLRDLLALAPRYQMIPLLVEGTALLAQALRSEGELEEALDAMTRHAELREALMANRAEEAVARQGVQARLDAVKKDAEIHRLKYVELQALQAQLLEAERMAALGTLTAGITHEMNTPLGAARSSLDTIRRGLERMEQADAGTGERLREVMRTAVETCESALRRIDARVDGLGRFVRLDGSDEQNVDLNGELETVIELLRPRVPDNVRIETRLEPLPRVRVQAGSLNQAFLTLLENGAQAMVPGGGTLRVATHHRAGALRVDIADEGPGIPEELRDRLFDMELSRRGPRARFRVGLALVKATVTRHGGRIDFESLPGAGTCFRIHLPLAEGA